MTHDELLAQVNKEVEMAEFEDACGDGNNPRVAKALRAVVELHYEDIGTPIDNPISVCDWCKVAYPSPTIQAIEKELQ